MTVTELSDRLKNMRFMKRSKTRKEKQSGDKKKKKRSSTKKKTEHILLNNDCAVVKDDSIIIYETYGRRSFGGFNTILEDSQSCGYQRNVSVSKKSVKTATEVMVKTSTDEASPVLISSKATGPVKGKRSKSLVYRKSSKIPRGIDSGMRRRSFGGFNAILKDNQSCGYQRNVSVAKKSVKTATEVMVKTSTDEASPVLISSKATGPVKGKRSKTSVYRKSSKIPRGTDSGKRHDDKSQKVIRSKRKYRRKKKKRIPRKKTDEEHSQLYKYTPPHMQQRKKQLVKVF